MAVSGQAAGIESAQHHLRPGVDGALRLPHTKRATGPDRVAQGLSEVVMRYLSLFSGIEAATAAWSKLGWECVAVAEIEPFPCSVLAHHYPKIRNLGDITKITRKQIQALGHIDVVVGGFPCQDLSIAGQRKGLKHADGTNTRSGLFFNAARIAEWSRARWTVVENVPGLFSSNGGVDFATVVGELAGAELGVPGGGWLNTGMALGPKGLVEWCVLDAQWRGLAQRRKRVFIVRDTGDWNNRPPLLLEPESLCGNPPPRREKREGITHELAPCIGASGRGFDRTGDTRGQDAVIPVASTLRSGSTNAASHNKASGLDENLIAHSLKADGHDASEDGTGRGTPIVVEQNNMAITPALPSLRAQESPNYAVGVPALAQCLNAGGQGRIDSETETQIPVAFTQNGDGDVLTGSGDAAVSTNSNASGRNSGKVNIGMAVRRLTPLECERLQGFPDGWTMVPHRGKPAADGPRYKAIGNSMATPVMLWLGQRIEDVSKL